MAETSAIEIGDQVEARHNSITVAAEQIANRKPWRPLPIAGVIQNDVVGGVTEYKLVQECRRESCAQAGYKTQAGALEVRAQSWKAASIGPEGDGLIFTDES